MGENSLQFDRKTLLAVLSVLTFGLAALAAIAGLDFLVLAIFVLGFFVVIPLAALLGDSLPMVGSDADDPEVGRESADDPIDQLRARYARGEVTDEEFERRLERLLETEGLEVVGETDRAFERK